MNKMISAAVLALGLAYVGIAHAAEVVKQDDAGNKLELGGTLFIKDTIDQQKNTDNAGVLTKVGTVGAEIDRAYLYAKYSFDENWMMRVTLDALYNAAATGKKSEVFIKHAYLQGKLHPAAIVEIGLIGTPWVPYEESLWKHRNISQSFVDRNKLDDSADAGVSLQGKLANGLVGYHLAAVNGRGFSDVGTTASTDKNIRLGIYPVEGLTVDLGYRFGYKGTRRVPDTVPSMEVTSTLSQAMLTYGGNTFRVGGNYILNTDKAKSTAVKTTKTAYDVWGWAYFSENYGLFGRYETMKTKRSNLTAAQVQQKDDRYVAGLDYRYNKHVTASLAWDHLKQTGVGFATKATAQDDRYGLYLLADF